MSDPFNAFPYRDRYAVQRALPQTGRNPAEVLAELGQMAAEMTLAWLTDNRDQRRLGADRQLVVWAGIDPEKLPPLVPTGSIAGTIRPALARSWGRRPMSPSWRARSICSLRRWARARPGTARVTLPCRRPPGPAVLPHKKTDVLHSIASVPGLDLDRYLVANNHETAGICLAWLVTTCWVPASMSRPPWRRPHRRAPAECSSLRGVGPTLPR